MAIKYLRIILSNARHRHCLMSWSRCTLISSDNIRNIPLLEIEIEFAYKCKTTFFSILFIASSRTALGLTIQNMSRIRILLSRYFRLAYNTPPTSNAKSYRLGMQSWTGIKFQKLYYIVVQTWWRDSKNTTCRPTTGPCRLCSFVCVCHTIDSFVCTQLLCYYSISRLFKDGCLHTKRNNEKKKKKTYQMRFDSDWISLQTEWEGKTFERHLPTMKRKKYHLIRRVFVCL